MEPGKITESEWLLALQKHKRNDCELPEEVYKYIKIARESFHPAISWNNIAQELYKNNLYPLLNSCTLRDRFIAYERKHSIA